MTPRSSSWIIIQSLSIQLSDVVTKQIETLPSIVPCWPQGGLHYFLCSHLAVIYPLWIAIWNDQGPYIMNRGLEPGLGGMIRYDWLCNLWIVGIPLKISWFKFWYIQILQGPPLSKTAGLTSKVYQEESPIPLRDAAAQSMVDSLGLSCRTSMQQWSAQSLAIPLQFHLMSLKAIMPVKFYEFL